MKNKQHILLFLKWTITILICAALTHYILKNLSDFKKLLSVELRYIAVISFLSIMDLFFLAYRYFLSIRLLTDNIRYATCIKYFVTGAFLSSVLTQAGNVYKAASLKMRNRVNLKQYISIQFFFSWSNLAFSLCIASVLVGFDPPQTQWGPAPVPLVFFTLLAFLMLTPFAVSRLLSRFRLDGHPKLIWLSSQIRASAHSFHALLKKPSVLFSISLILCAHFITNILILRYAFENIGVPLSFPVLAVFLVITRMGNLINITPSNIGIREFIFGALAHSFRFPIEAGVSASLIIRLLNFLIYGLFAMICHLTDRCGRK